MIDRIQQSVDFEKVLSTAPCARSGMFAVHHVKQLPHRPGPAKYRAKTTDETDLSTDPSEAVEKVVENQVSGWWLGLVVPKRFARRSVTRQLVKRQIRAAMARSGSGLEPGLWVVKLRAPLDIARFPSAKSDALSRLLIGQLQALFDRALGKGTSSRGQRAPSVQPVIGQHDAP